MKQSKDDMCRSEELLMFEFPFKSDFDFGAELGSSAQHPFSLRSRLREVRDAFRGFRYHQQFCHVLIKITVLTVNEISIALVSLLTAQLSDRLIQMVFADCLLA
ncbi:unnamed protein product [Acanthocheilonema viteae]|uniref:Uncharacterized protein n=1 Tax=Acanthocheilonema viteae TaxID=6277 RepID=A0A498S5P9_ACAVI|nr:unnamed protein product [Acanthocheilonema viteae]